MKFKLNEKGFYELDVEVKTSVSYPQHGNSDCFELEEHSQWFNARNLTLHWLLSKFDFSGSFVDVGGGNGYQLSFLQKTLFEFKGIDSGLCEPGYLGCLNASSRGVKNIYCTTSDYFPYSNFNAGGLGFFDVIEHIENDAEFLQSIAEKVEKGTRFYITVPALKFLFSSEDSFAGHFRRYNSQNTKELIDDSGLKLIYESYFFSYYVPFVWLLRVVPEKLGLYPKRDESFDREKSYHKQSAALKWMLNAMHGIELLLMRIGIKPFAGTSRIIILEKE